MLHLLLRLFDPDVEHVGDVEDAVRFDLVFLGALMGILITSGTYRGRLLVVVSEIGAIGYDFEVSIKREDE